MRGERVGEGLHLLGADREARRGAVAAEALEVLGTRSEPAVEVEGGERPPRALPQLVRSRDEHDRPIEALDETRGDDADHALVPVGAGDDVPAPAALRLRPGLDLRHGRAEDPVLDLLPLAVQLLETRREAARLLLVLGEDQVERCAGVPEPPGGVDPRREPEADRAGVDGGGVDVRRPHQRTQAGLSRPGERAEAGGGEEAVLVEQRARRRRSWRARRGRGAASRRRHSASASFTTTPVPQSSGKGYSDGFVATTGQSGSSSPGRWWSVTTTSRPSAFASATSFTAVIPQSTVTTRPQPSSASRAIVVELTP